MNQDSVVLEITFTSSLENVWGAWTNPGLMTWFGSDPNGKVLSADVDVRVGGRFEVTFQDADLTTHTCYGIYEDVQPFSKLVFSWQWKSEPNVESYISLLLFPIDKFTVMQFEHKNFGNGSKHDYEKGWRSTFVKLERLLNTLN
jgi:uncharacterized protein YndB with AHSA1/START domain